MRRAQQGLCRQLLSRTHPSWQQADVSSRAASVLNSLDDDQPSTSTNATYAAPIQQTRSFRTQQQPLQVISGSWHAQPPLQPFGVRHLSFWKKSKPAAETTSAAAPLEPEVSSGDGAAPAPELPVIEEPVVVEPTGFPLPDSSGTAAVAISEACDAVETAAMAAAHEESMFSAVWFMDAINYVHTSMGLPWWASIMLINVITRTATLPLMLATQRTSAQMATLQLDAIPLKKIQEAMSSATNLDDRMRAHKALQAEMESFKAKAAPAYPRIMATMFGSMCVNGFAFISIFNAVNNLMAHKAPSLTEGGMYWFTDLTTSDPYYGLPALCTLTTLGLVEFGMNITGEQIASPQRAEQTKRVKNIFRFMALLFLPFGGYVPAGIALLWVSNSFFSVVMGAALRQDGLRRALALPAMADLQRVSEQLQIKQDMSPWQFVPPPPPPPPAPAPAAGDGTDAAAAPDPALVAAIAAAVSAAAAANGGKALGTMVPPPPSTPAKEQQ